MAPQRMSHATLCRTRHPYHNLLPFPLKAAIVAGRKTVKTIKLTQVEMWQCRKGLRLLEQELASYNHEDGVKQIRSLRERLAGKQVVIYNPREP